MNRSIPGKAFLLLAVFLAAGPATEARAQPAAARPLEISFWTPFTGGDGEFFSEMVKAYNASQGEIVMKTDTLKFASYYTKLSGALAAGTAPDIVIVHQDRLIGYAASGAFMPLDAALAAAKVDKAAFVQGPLKDCSFKGSVYAIPMDVHPIVMYYNKDLLARAGVAKPPSSLDELIAAAKTVQARTGAIGIAADNTTATYKAYTLARMFMSLLMEQGVSTLDADNAKANFNNAAGAKAYDFLSGLVNREKVTPRGLDYDFAVNYFKTGKAAMHFNGVWVTGAFEAEPGLDFGVVKFPAIFGKSAAWSGSHAFAVPVQKKQDPRKLAAVMKVIDWMTLHGELWAKAGHIPTRSSVFAKPEFKALPHRAEYADAAEHSFATPPAAQWPACYAAISDSLEESIAQNRDARTALSLMEAKVNAILKNK
jgi:multiple sugar transport system substrate-binding protein